MSDIFSSFFGSPPKPEPITAAPPTEPPKKKKSRKAQLLALKATGPGGLQDEANISKKRILI